MRVCLLLGCLASTVLTTSSSVSAAEVKVLTAGAFKPVVTDVVRGARVFVEYEPQTRVEGDIQQLPSSFPVVDLWRVLAGTVPGRQSAAQVTVFDSVGFALEDYSTLRYVHEQALRRGIGRDVELIPETCDPKDLFRFTRPDALVAVERLAA